MNALQLRPPSEESREHLLRRPVRRLPYPTTEHLPLGMFHTREEGDGQRTADQKLLMHIIQKRKKFNTAGGDLFACCIKNKFEIFNSLNDPVHIKIETEHVKLVNEKKKKKKWTGYCRCPITRMLVIRLPGLNR